MFNKLFLILTSIVLFIIILITACAVPSPPLAVKNQTATPQRPPIDLIAPSAIETATFALG